LLKYETTFMTEHVSIVFPHQLFENNPCLDKHRRVFILEDDLFFTQLPFHKLKLMLHHATMHYYEDFLKFKNYRVTYIDQASYHGLEDFIKKDLANESVKSIHFCDPVDYLLRKRLFRFAAKYGLEIHEYESPNFINSRQDNEELLQDKERFFLADFYKSQRKKLNILVENGKPVGGKWSYDSENRKALPKGKHVDSPLQLGSNSYVLKAKEYVEKNFPNNPGKTDHFVYPITFEDGRVFLEHFIDYRLSAFGMYQDAFSDDFPFVYHSVISASMNIGIIQPDYVVDKILQAYQSSNYSLASVEGFLRQIIGWREFVRAVYEKKGSFQRTHNFWGFSQKIKPLEHSPIGALQKTLKKLENFAYAHHIERLMLLGNYFLLTETHPDQVYRFFMIYSIDSYDWVMVPNVYGMSQFSDGGLMTTKPYISSTNYLKKQGLEIDPTWKGIWDALYWNFLEKHRTFFEKNPRLKAQLYHLDGMSSEKLEKHLSIAESHLLKEVLWNEEG
jgi:deoxyribodipyrimidine photolyase-related protein